MAKKKTIIQEFGEFISRGNVLDLAVGIIVGGAFTAVVNSLVTNLVQPLISFITGCPYLNGNILDFSAFISAIINFLITAAAVFAIVKSVNSFRQMKDAAAAKAGLAKKVAEEAAPVIRTCPYCKSDIADDATRCPHCTAKLPGYTNPQE